MRWVAHGECELPPTTEWLSERESAQVATIRFTKRRVEFLTRRWTAKHAVAMVLGAVWTLPRSRASRSATVRAVHPTSSWTDGCRHRPVTQRPRRMGRLPGGAARRVGCGSLGIDLELVESRSDAVRHRLLYCGGMQVRRLPAGEARDEAANLIWSAKESALKVLKLGLRADTRDVEVYFDRSAAPMAGRRWP